MRSRRGRRRSRAASSEATRCSEGGVASPPWSYAALEQAHGQAHGDCRMEVRYYLLDLPLARQQPE